MEKTAKNASNTVNDVNRFRWRIEPLLTWPQDRQLKGYAIIRTVPRWGPMPEEDQFYAWSPVTARRPQAKALAAAERALAIYQGLDKDSEAESFGVTVWGQSGCREKVNGGVWLTDPPDLSQASARHSIYPAYYKQGAAIPDGYLITKKGKPKSPLKMVFRTGSRRKTLLLAHTLSKRIDAKIKGTVRDASDLPRWLWFLRKIPIVGRFQWEQRLYFASSIMSEIEFEQRKAIAAKAGGK